MNKDNILLINQIISRAIFELKDTKTQFANEIEITNANSKGVKQVTIKGRSDKPLEELLKKVNETYEKVRDEKD